VWFLKKGWASGADLGVVHFRKPNGRPPAQSRVPAESTLFDLVIEVSVGSPSLKTAQSDHRRRKLRDPL
jgi:hypothetical protein